MTERDERIGDALANLVLEVRETLTDWQSLGVDALPASRPLDELTALDDLPKYEAQPAQPARPAPEVRAAPPPTRQPVMREPTLQAKPPPKAKPPTREATRPPANDLSTGAWATYAHAVQGDAGLEPLREQVLSCQLCGLCQGRTNAVFGVGASSAKIAIVGEAPGYHEDQTGEPFVGKAGAMLDNMLQHVLRLERSEVFITNVIKCRPPENRTPTPDELSACQPYLKAQLALIQPHLILAVGRIAAQALLDRNQGIGALRGRWGLFEGIPVMPTFHPAYLLRKPQDKRFTFEDLKLVRARMDQLGLD